MRTPPPIYDPIVDEDGKVTLSWITYFNNIYTGDFGTSWTPTFTSLGSTGTPTITGIYKILSEELVLVRVQITPATDTTSTAGTTYINNFPLTLKADGAVFAVSNGIGGSAGHAIASNNRIYTPGWAAFTTPVIVTGLLEAT